MISILSAVCLTQLRVISLCEWLLIFNVNSICIVFYRLAWAFQTIVSGYFNLFINCLKIYEWNSPRLINKAIIDLLNFLSYLYTKYYIDSELGLLIRVITKWEKMKFIREHWLLGIWISFMFLISKILIRWYIWFLFLGCY